jgi:hypothetical protein
MRIPALPIVASLALFAAPAFAQSSTATPTSPSDTSPSTSAATSTSPGPTEMNGGGKLSLDTQQKIRQSLEQSGFKDISVAPESFVIRAQAPDGSHIVMMMTPDMTTGVIEHTGSSSAPGVAAPSSSGGDTGPATH